MRKRFRAHTLSLARRSRSSSKREEVGGRAARCRCGCRHEWANWVARWRILARRLPTDGHSARLRTLVSHRQSDPTSRLRV